MARKAKRVKVESDSEDEEVFHVEVILGARVGEDSEWEYLVKWYGYDKEEDNTWEPWTGIQGTCRRLLTEFWKEIGLDNNDYQVGFTVTPRPEWIKKEKRYFRQSLAKDAKAEKSKALTREEEEAFLPKGSYESSRKKKDGRATSASSTTAKSKRTTTKTTEAKSRKRKRSLSAASSSSSESDVPLSQLSKSPKGKASKQEEKRKLKVSANPEASKDSSTNFMLQEDLPDDLKFSDDEPAPPPPPPPPAKPKMTIQTKSIVIPKASTSRTVLQQSPASASLHGTPTIPQAKAPAAPNKMPMVSEPSPQVPKVPAHRLPGRIKVMAPGELFGGFFSGNATKQRLANGSGTSKSATLPSFKKNKPSETSAPMSAHERTSSTSSLSIPPNASFLKPKPSNNNTPTSSNFHSPILPFSKSPQPECQWHASDSMTTEADSFLESNPLLFERTPPGECNFPAALLAQPPVSAPSVSRAGLPRIPKLFKWEGDLVCFFEGSPERKLCGRVTIAETQIGTAECIRFEQALPSYLPVLTLSSFCHASDVGRRLSARDNTYRIATLRSDPSSHQVVSTLSNYAAKYSKVLIATTSPSAKDTVEGIIILFPPSSSIRRHFRVSPPPGTQLLVALIPTLSPTPLLPPQRRLTTQPPHNPLHSTVPDVVQHAISILHFPDWLHSFLSSAKCEYCLWYDSTSKAGKRSRLPFDINKVDYETAMLDGILQQYRGQNVGYFADATVIFVQVSAIKTLHLLPAFLERVWKRLDFTFVTYGTHVSVPPTSWGMRKIYPVGGMVTFSPAAFIDEPWGVYNKAKRISERQFWSFWMTPATLGMIVRTHYGTTRDALAAFEDKSFVLSYLLDDIAEGVFSFGSLPPSASLSSNNSQDFLSELAVVVGGGQRDILEYALHVYEANFANQPLEKRTKTLLDGLAAEVRTLQLHPSLMERYRRFILLATDEEVKAHTSDPFEWRTHETFTFRYKKKV